MSEQLFNQETTKTPETQDATATLLASIKNEQGQQKYATVEEALKGLQHAQGYISSVKSERDDFMQKYEQERQAAERVAELERLVQDLTQRQESSAKKPDAPSIDPEAITNLVKSQLASARQEEQQSLNRQTVKSALVGKLGEEKAAEFFNQKAIELGMDASRLTQLASESPQAVLAMLGVSGEGASKQPRFSPSSPSIRTEGVPQRRESLIGKREAFTLPVGHTSSDVAALKERSDQLLEELNEQGITVDDLTNPANYFKIFK